MRRHLVLLITLAALLVGCDNPAGNGILVECPADIAALALSYAYEYSQADTKYEWGGQDLLRSVKIDCSGLIVNCYTYAVRSTQYYLPFNDATVITFYSEWTVETDFPRPGDLISMGDNKETITHMAIFAREEDSCIFFIDSTLKPENNINGASERFYHKSDDRFIGFGKLKLYLR